MKARSAALQGTLAIVGLTAAYFTWQRPPEKTDGDVVVLDASRSDLRSLKFEDDRRVVEVVPEGDTVWIRQTEKPPPPKPAAAGADAGTTVAAATPPEPTTDGKAREYKGNESAEKLMERFAPLQAARALGVLSPEKLDEVGLTGSKRQLEVVTGTGTRRFTLSQATQGVGSPYLRNDADGAVFLAQATLISDLEFASSRLVDRRLHTFNLPEFDGLQIRSGDRERRLVKSGDKWAPEDGQGAPDEFATNWHDKLWRLTGIEVLARGENPAAGEPKIELRVEYLRGEKPVGFVELAQAGSDTFARTEHTAGWVRLHGGAAQILSEREQVLEKR